MPTSVQILDAIKNVITTNSLISSDEMTLGVRSKSGVTFHEAVRSSLEMRTNDSYYMYWEWRELRRSFESFWIELDLAASNVAGRPTTAIALLGTNPALAITVLDRANPDRIPDFVLPHRRPTSSESQVRFVGKLLGSCLQTMGIVATNAEIPLGQVLSRIAGNDFSDEELLEFLDRWCLEIAGDVTTLKKPNSAILLRALGFAYQTTTQTFIEEFVENLSLADFIKATNDTSPWASYSDSGLLRRLLDISPDETESSKRAIDKFLNA